MGHRPLLLAMHSTDPPWDHDGRYLRDALLGSKTTVPILWLSLFDTDGLVSWPSIYDGSPYTAVIQPTSECVERSRTRLEDWSRRWPGVFADMSKIWLGYVGALEEPYLASWAEELRWFYPDDESWAAEFRDGLGSLDHPESERFRSELAAIGLGSDGRFEPGYFTGVLTAGFTWARQAPWEGAGHGPYWTGPSNLSAGSREASADIDAHLSDSVCRVCARWPGKLLLRGIIPMTGSRPPFPPFDTESALKKVQAAEDAWNTRDPEKVSLAYTQDSVWRNRGEHLAGREQIVAFLTRKWQRELGYALRKNLWSFGGNRIAVRFQYESHDTDGQWWRSYGNELWEFAPNGLMARREASINDRRITPAERRIFGPRPASERGQDFDFPLW